MLNVRFKKINSACYISHIDMQRVINRTFLRAGLQPKMSNGFNPHSLLKLSSPIPLGIQSLSEYLSIDIDGIDINTIIGLLNDNSPGGIVYQKAWITKNNPNFAANLVAARYFIKSSDAISKKALIISKTKADFVIDHKGKNGVEQRQVGELIKEINIDENGIDVLLAFGNTSLRADRFIMALNNYFDLGLKISDIVKKEAYFIKKEENSYINADDYMDGLKEAPNEIY